MLRTSLMPNQPRPSNGNRTVLLDSGGRKVSGPGVREPDGSLSFPDIRAGVVTAVRVTESDGTIHTVPLAKGRN